MSSTEKKRVELWDVIEQEIDEHLIAYEQMGEPIELNADRRPMIVGIIHKYLNEQLEQQVFNALSSPFVSQPPI